MRRRTSKLGWRRVIRYLKYHEPDSGELSNRTKIRQPKPWKIAK